MVRHVPEERLMDAVMGIEAPETLAHLKTCAQCRERVEAARAGLLLARPAKVPEPSPLYWEAFRRQVGRRLEGAAAPFWRWRPALVAAAALLVALAVLLPRPVSTPVSTSVVPEALPAWSPLPPSEEDAGLSLLRAVTKTAEDLGPAAEGRGVAECLAGLSDEESLALADLLRQAMSGGAS